MSSSSLLLFDRNRKRNRQDQEPILVLRTYDAQIELPPINLETTTGIKLFESICTSLGLRERWYFGLAYDIMRTTGVSNKYRKWIRMNKKLSHSLHNALIIKDSNSNQNPSTKSLNNNRLIIIFLLIKYYPLQIENIILPYTIHLFYLDAKLKLLNENEDDRDMTVVQIKCPTQLCLLLASYALQARFGDYIDCVDNLNDVSLINEIPQSIQMQFHKLTKNDWEDKIKQFWSNHLGLEKEDAELEYLKHLSSLETYGVKYFKIKDLITRKQHSSHNNNLYILAIYSNGIKIYREQVDSDVYKSNEVDTKSVRNDTIEFKWSQITNIRINSELLQIKCINQNGSSSTSSASLSHNHCSAHVKYSFIIIDNKLYSKEISELCIGYYDLYCKQQHQSSMIAKRGTQAITTTIDIQHMKQQALDMKLKRQEEKLKLQREREMRLEAEKRCIELESKLNEYKKNEQTFKNTEETIELLSEKVKFYEEEANLLKLKSIKLEAKMNIYKLLAERKEHEKRYYEFKTVESELLLHHLLEDQQQSISLNNYFTTTRTTAQSNSQNLAAASSSSSSPSLLIYDKFR